MWEGLCTGSRAKRGNWERGYLLNDKVKFMCAAEPCTTDAFSFQDHMRGMSHSVPVSTLEGWSAAWKFAGQSAGNNLRRTKGLVGSKSHIQMPGFGRLQRMTVTGTDIWTGKTVPSSIFGHGYCRVYYCYHHRNYSPGWDCAWDQISF